MPTYQYRCRDCDENLEVVQSFTDDPLTECPSCGGELRKVFAAPGIAFKGSGFYKTDSRKKATAKSSSNGSDGASSSESKSESKSDGSGSTDSKTKPKGDNKSETKASSKKSEKTPSSSSS